MTVLFSDICGDLSFNAAPPQMPRRITPRWWVVSSFVSIDLIFCFYTEHVLHCTGEGFLETVAYAPVFISAFSLFLSFSLSVYKSIGAFRPHSCFPVTIQIKLDQSFRLNLFLSYLQRIAFLGELLGQRSRHESLRRPLIEPVRRHIVLNTFGSLESRDFRTRKNPSINRFSLAVSSLPHIPY